MQVCTCNWATGECQGAPIDCKAIAENARLIEMLRSLADAADDFQADPAPDDGGEAICAAIDNARKLLVAHGQTVK